MLCEKTFIYLGVGWKEVGCQKAAFSVQSDTIWLQFIRALKKRVVKPKNGKRSLFFHDCTSSHYTIFLPVESQNEHLYKTEPWLIFKGKLFCSFPWYQRSTQEPYLSIGSIQNPAHLKASPVWALVLFVFYPKNRSSSLMLFNQDFNFYSLTVQKNSKIIIKINVGAFGSTFTAESQTQPIRILFSIFPSKALPQFFLAKVYWA